MLTVFVTVAWVLGYWTCWFVSREKERILKAQKDEWRERCAELLREKAGMVKTEAYTEDAEHNAQVDSAWYE